MNILKFLFDLFSFLEVFTVSRSPTQPFFVSSRNKDLRLRDSGSGSPACFFRSIHVLLLLYGPSFHQSPQSDFLEQAKHLAKKAMYSSYTLSFLPSLQSIECNLVSSPSLAPYICVPYIFDLHDIQTLNTDNS